MIHFSKTVSVIIPTYNEEENIFYCLESIKNYATHVEIIVVDNFSTDKTAKLAKQLTNLVFQKGSERSKQRNFGAYKAKGNYLLFLDADMRLPYGTFDEALNMIQKGKYIIAFPEISVGKTFWEKSVVLERNLYKQEKLLAAARLFPRKLFYKLGGFDERLVSGEDWDLTIRAKKLGYKFMMTKNSITHVEKIKNLIMFLRKKRYYSSNVFLYRNKHPEFFLKQSSLKYRLMIYLKNWPKLIFDPFHTAGFLFLKMLIWYDWWRHED